MNVMLTSAGRRNYSVEIFKEVVGDRAACLHAIPARMLRLCKKRKAFIVPRVDQEDYIDTFLAILLTMNRARFFAIGTIPLVSPPEITATCCDKLATSKLSKCGLLAPQTFDSLAARRMMT
jgi:carbamoyl-phosphate synthase large subunit